MANRSYVERGDRYIEMKNLTLKKLLHDLELDDMLPEGARPVAIKLYRTSIDWPEHGVQVRLEWERNAVFVPKGK